MCIMYIKNVFMYTDIDVPIKCKYDIYIIYINKLIFTIFKYSKYIVYVLRSFKKYDYINIFKRLCILI